MAKDAWDNKPGTGIGNQYKLLAKQPIDARYVAANIAERDLLESKGAAYLGLEVWVEETKKKYRYIGEHQWIDINDYANLTNKPNLSTYATQTWVKDTAVAYRAQAIKQTDTRSANETAPHYYDQARNGGNFVFEFKYCNKVGLTPTIVGGALPKYGQMQTYAKWTDSTGGNITQTFIADERMFIRQSNYHGKPYPDPEYKDPTKYGWNEWREFAIADTDGNLSENGIKLKEKYIQTSGGTFTGPINFPNATALPQKDLNYICGIDGFADKTQGQMGWQTKSSFLAGYATQNWVRDTAVAHQAASTTGTLTFTGASTETFNGNNSPVVHIPNDAITFSTDPTAKGQILRSMTIGDTTWIIAGTDNNIGVTYEEI